MNTAVISDFNADLFGRILENTSHAVGKVASFPFGQVFQSLLSVARGDLTVLNSDTTGKFQTDASQPHLENLIIWTRAESILPAFQRGLEFQNIDAEKLQEDVDTVVDLILECSPKVKNVFVMSWMMPLGHSGQGMLDYRPQSGLQFALNEANNRLSARLSSKTNVYVLNVLNYFLACSGRTSNPKLFYSAKVPFSTDVFKWAANDISSAIAGLNGKARRVVVLDLDNTLWGGILGDVGIEGIRLGGHDHTGEAFVDFQRVVKALTNKGIALAIASKNYESNALAAIKNHPEMILRLEDISAWRINWDDKAKNIVEIAQELNLGLSSFVFIDDNPAERARVAEALPEVLVPDWPEDPALYKEAFLKLACFNVPSISEEDRTRVTMFAAERTRKQLRESLSHEEWLATINMSATVNRLTTSNQSRVTQLINKSNQFNALARKIAEQDLVAWAAHPGHYCWSFRVADKYGDSGLTGVISAERVGSDMQISDFVMSCRVMGRQLENLMLGLVIQMAAENGASKLYIDFVPTDRNAPMRDFLDRSGLKKEGDHYEWNCVHHYPLPSHIRLIDARNE